MHYKSTIIAFIATSLYIMACGPLHAQKPLPGADLSNEKAQRYAIINATLHHPDGRIEKNATLRINGRKIEAISTTEATPKGYIVIDAKGRHIYPGFIDLYSHFGMPAIMPERKQPTLDDLKPKYDRNTAAPLAWNEAIKAEVRSCETLQYNEKEAEDLLKLGVTTVLTGSKDGIFRGTWALYNLGNPEEKENILISDAVQALSFNKGSSKQSYPSSQMGAIALIRQTLLDAEWYAQAKPEEKNLSLQAINQYKNLPYLFEAKDKLEVLRIANICKEFSLQRVAIKTAGNDYQRAREIAQTKALLIIPLQFPPAFQIDDLHDAHAAEYAELKHWEAAPYNARLLKEAGVNYAFTLADLKDKKELWKILKKLHETGLTEKDLLQAFCTQPTRLLGADKLTGKLEKDYLANFFITDKTLEEGVENVFETWAAGTRLSHIPLETNYKAGIYNLIIENTRYEWHLLGTPTKPESKIILKDTTKTSVPLKWDSRTNYLSFNLKLPAPDSTGETRFSGFAADSIIKGIALSPQGTSLRWQAKFVRELSQTTKAPAPDKSDKNDSIPQIIYPFEAFGTPQLPRPASFLLQNATVWTCESQGILQNTDVWIANGKIKMIGKNIKASQGTIVIDATGKHITPGIIDEHSHIAISKGVNEGSHNNTAEVRIGDAVNSEDINIYRHLAGGVTLVQQLHGSANCIGGQSNLLKMKWGYAPDSMKLSNQPGFIKFALGENVKQSNWGDFNTIRYPQTRMGVEQVYFDGFINAKQYAESWAKWRKAKNKSVPPRRDLKYEALVEILEGKRFITCHSYVQSEINMLMKVADSLKFKVNTFTHILEGYKVADKMRIHGANASTFADWWAYKMEVNDAIPYNAAILQKAGVNTCINSDDAEMARRLNQEAAKAIKYGNVSEEEALKMVTINPAKALRVAERTGSLKIGKDADVVIWSGNPLSQYSVVEHTFVDGIHFFDRSEMERRYQQIVNDKNRLIQKTIRAKKTEPGIKPQLRPQKLWHCEDLEEFHMNYDDMP